MLDSNIVVAAAIKHDNPPGLVFDMFLRGTIINYTSDAILQELLEVASRPPIRERTGDFDSVVRLFERHSRIIYSTERIRACRDPDDDKFLECALAADAEFIITGDRALLEIGEYKGIRILTASEFLQASDSTSPYR